jgi:hypothetical protein
MARTGLEGKDLGWRHLRQVGVPDGLGGGTTRQPQQDQSEEREQGGANATLNPAATEPAGAAARAAAVRAAAVRAAARPGRQSGRH